MLYYDEENKEESKATSQPTASARTVTNPAVSQAQQPAWTQAMGAHPPASLQTNLAVNQPGDAYEQEADQVADQVMRMPSSGTPTEQEDSSLMRKGQGGASATQSTPPIVGSVLSSGGGQPLDASTRATMEPRFGQDFSQVRVHTDEQAAESAQAVNARAYTVGRDVVFRTGEYSPGTSEGQRLLAHELTHVVQQTSSLSSSRTVQRALRPEDVSSEMVGRYFTVTQDFSAPFGTIHPWDTLVVRTWVNSSSTVTVALPPPSVNAGIDFSVPKAILTPVQTPVAGIAQYHAGLPGAESAVTSGQAEIDALRARESTYRTPRARALFTSELGRLVSRQTVRERNLNRRLIQETLFNRFDSLIQQWTSFYNTQFSGMHWGPLDPNLVKSMFFQESQLGTSGSFLNPAVSGGDPITAQFNLGSMIDSSASALLLMISEMLPALLTTHHLENIRTNLSAAQAELRHLQAQRSPLNSAQSARRAELIRLSGPGTTWETFLWEYHAPGQATGFADAVEVLFASGPAGRPLSEDYEFWIRTAIRWLFEKRRGVGSWEEAIRAYNGSGAAARHYRDIVVGRARRAESSGATGIVPEGI